MANNLIFTLMFLMLQVVYGAQQQPSNITLGSILYPNRNQSSWLSSSGLFSFGFYKKGDGFQVGIWLADKTVVWTANRDDPPVHSDAYIEFTNQGKLILFTKQNVKVIAESPKPVTSASILDSGNFVMYNDTNVVWASFDHPTDTILAGQRLTSGQSLVSSVTEVDHSSGRFYLSMQADGNLVAYPANYLNRPEASYWAFMLQSRGEFGDVSSVFIGLTPTGQLFRNASNGFRFQVNTIANSSRREESVIYRATLDLDGIFRLYTHSFGVDNSSLEINWSALQNQCQSRGFCGVNSYCTSRNGSSKGDCSCFPGFLYVNRAMKFQGCYRGFVYEESCGSIRDSTLAYNVTAIQHLKLGGYPFSQVSMFEQDCRNSCLGDCTCWAAVYMNGVCSKFKLPFIYSTLDPTDDSVKTFVKQSYNISQMVGHSLDPHYSGKTVNRNKSRKKIILILSIALASVAFLLTVVAIFSYVFYRSRENEYQKLLENPYLGPNEEFTLRSFSFSELEKATEHFKEEIRHGSFGNLYKGILSEGNRTVAVKRLDQKLGDEGEKEFKAEMTAIGQARHKNLVHLLGFCLEGSEKILVYEYMSKGSLADILFNSEIKPSWEQRLRLALDISRGIRYLHEECETCIIHCNIKPDNILVDDLWMPKISDFGLAKFLVPDEVGNQVQVKGTRGYSAPELKNSALMISDKVDVYSYGVMLLEIICCRSNNMDVNVSSTEDDEIFLPTFVYKCFVENDLEKLVAGDEEVDVVSLERMIKVGLLCIHDNPELRPSMGNVVLMLEGTMDIPFLTMY